MLFMLSGQQEHRTYILSMLFFMIQDWQYRKEAIKVSFDAKMDTQDMRPITELLNQV
jgi:hypothetical protein